MDNPENNAQLDIVQQRWRDITLPEARRVLLALAEPLSASAMISRSARPTAAGAMVATDCGNVYIKRYHASVRDVCTIHPYQRYVAWLAGHGMNVMPFLPFDAARHRGADGCTFTVGSYVYEVCAQAPGEDRYAHALTWDPPATLDEARGLGETVARIALASRGFDEPRAARPDPYQNRFGLFAAGDFDEEFDGWLDARPAVRRYLERTGRNWRRDLEPYRAYMRHVAPRYGELPESWTHGDPHVSNMLWKGHAPSSVIDFGLADRNTALFDLVEAIERNAIQFVQIMDGQTDACRSDVARAIIESYERLRPLSDVERDVLPWMLPLAQAEASLNWIAYFVDGPMRDEDADWCYDTAFNAHAAWFGTPDGRRFLDDVRRAL